MEIIDYVAIVVMIVFFYFTGYYHGWSDLKERNIRRLQIKNGENK